MFSFVSRSNFNCSASSDVQIAGVFIPAHVLCAFGCCRFCLLNLTSLSGLSVNLFPLFLLLTPSPSPRPLSLYSFPRPSPLLFPSCMFLFYFLRSPLLPPIIFFAYTFSRFPSRPLSSSSFTSSFSRHIPLFSSPSLPSFLHDCKDYPIIFFAYTFSYFLFLPLFSSSSSTSLISSFSRFIFLFSFLYPSLPSSLQLAEAMNSMKGEGEREGGQGERGRNNMVEGSKGERGREENRK